MTEETKPQDDPAVAEELKGVPEDMIDTGDESTKLREELETARQEVLYAKAETQNVRRRLEKDIADTRAYAATSFARDILSVADNLSRALESIPADLRDVIQKSINASAADQREDIAKLNATLKTDLTSKGMEFVAVDQKPFRAKLEQAGFYKEWRGKYGEEAWAMLEKYTGKIS